MNWESLQNRIVYLSAQFRSFWRVIFGHHQVLKVDKITEEPCYHTEVVKKKSASALKKAGCHERAFQTGERAWTRRPVFATPS